MLNSKNMKTKFKWTTSLTIIISLLMLNLSCGYSANYSKPAAQMSGDEKNISDLDIFKGIVFATGPVAKKLGYFANDPDPATDKAINLIVNHLEAEDPKYISRFANTMKSKNHYKISESLQNTIQDISYVAPFERNPKECGVAVVCVAAAAAAVHNVAVATAVAVAAVATMVTVATSKNGNTIPFEEYTNSIVTSL